MLLDDTASLRFAKGAQLKNLQELNNNQANNRRIYIYIYIYIYSILSLYSVYIAFIEICSCTRLGKLGASSCPTGNGRFHIYLMCTFPPHNSGLFFVTVIRLDFEMENSWDGWQDLKELIINSVWSYLRMYVHFQLHHNILLNETSFSFMVRKLKLG